jgi:inhibitor of KinA sporulation pathway (predicted exonuclease)
MRFIAIDLEIEQPKTNPQCPDSETDEEKLIQVGLVVFEIGEEIKVLESVTMFKNYPGKLSSFIKKLTSITDEQVNTSTNSVSTILAEIRNLREKYNTSRQIVEWGAGDKQFLMKESGLNSGEFREYTGLANSTINVKVLFQLYALKKGLKAQGGLGKSLRKVGLEFQATKYEGKQYGAHWAESDALNTAIIFNFVINKFN